MQLLWQTACMLRILLIDDHAIVRAGFKSLIAGTEGFEVVAEAGNAASALEMARRHQPDLAVLDLSLGGDSGLSLLPRLRDAVPGMRVVLLSMHEDPSLVLRAVEEGAQGYVTKAVAAEELIALLRRAATGEIVFSSDLLPNTGQASHTVRLTPRERETLRGLLSDRPPKAIAADLGISDKTLYRHRANLMEKLGARTQGDLTRIVREHGLLLELGQD